jgi:hypothetical protein
MQPRREYQGGRNNHGGTQSISQSGRKAKFIDTRQGNGGIHVEGGRNAKTSKVGRQAGKETDMQEESSSQARKKGAGKSMEGIPRRMQEKACK